ncbi:MAG: sporulation protein [Myxococcales bacterium]|nr:sporulation protein [Myxococcales bacterium]
MGLFDAFGVGGGDLHIQLQFPTAQAGGVLQGTVVFQAGRRAQNIKNITVKLACTTQVQTPQGPQSRSQDVSPPGLIAQAFSAQPGQSYSFPFQIPVPPGAFSSAPGMVSYRLSANADIDGEVDPGAGADIQVQGEPYQGFAGGPGMMPMGGYDKAAAAKMQAMHDPYAQKGAHDPYAQKGYDAGAKGGYDPYAAQKGYDAGAKGGHDPYAQKGYDAGAKGGYDPYAAQKGYDAGAKGAYGGHHLSPGAHCLAQWSDGGYYGVTVVQVQGNMVMVQWDDGTPASWVRTDQTQPG